MKLINKLSNRGDTIVEVLIAVAIMGIVLTGAYAIANRSTTGIRQGQERAEALKIAESQVERLKAGAAITSSGVFSHTNPFCAYIISSGAAIQTAAPADPGNHCQVNNGVTYDISVERTHISTHIYLFNISITWDSATGNGKDKVIMKYRLDT